MLRLRAIAGDAQRHRGTAAPVGVDEQIQAVIGIPVRVINPFTRVALGPRVSPVRFTNDMQALLISAGLSLRGLE